MWPRMPPPSSPSCWHGVNGPMVGYQALRISTHRDGIGVCCSTLQVASVGSWLVGGNGGREVGECGSSWDQFPHTRMGRSLIMILTIFYCIEVEACGVWPCIVAPFLPVVGGGKEGQEKLLTY